MELSFIALLLVLLCAWGVGVLAQRLGIPAVLGELMAGIVFGPPLLGLIQPSDAIGVLADVGVFLMMLYIGMEINLRELKKSGLAASMAAIGGFVVPLGAVYVVLVAVGVEHVAALVAGTAAGVTSLAVGSRLLIDLRLMKTRLASVLTTAALLSDTVALVLFAATASVIDAGGFAVDRTLLLSAKIVAFFVVAVLIGVYVLPRLAPLLERLGLKGRTAHFTMVLIVALFYAELAELAGLHSILGAFLAGMFLGEGVLAFRLAHELRTLVHDLSIGFLAPIFFVQSGFSVSFAALRQDLWLVLAVIVVATVGKTVGALALYVLGGRPWREGLAVGVGMNGRGALDIVIAGIALEAGLIDARVFSLLVVLAIVATMGVPVLLKASIAWLRRRGELTEVERRQGVLFVGAGPTVLEIGRRLATTRKVTVVDSNDVRCTQAAGLGMHAVYGNAADENTLQEAGAGEAQIVVAMTPNPQINMFTARLAREVFLVPEVYLYLAPGERERADDALDNLDVTAFDLGSFSLADWDHWVAHGRVQPLEREAARAMLMEDLVTKAHTAQPWLPLTVRRGERPLLAFGLHDLEEGDRVEGIALPVTVDAEPADEFSALIREAPIVDLEGELQQDEAFVAAASELAKHSGFDALDIAAKLNERERADSTVLSRGLAVPHAVVDGNNLFALAVVRARQGIRMHTQPGAAPIVVYAMFVTVSSRDMRGLHLRALSAIAQVFHNDDFADRWLAAGGAENLRALLLGAKRKRFGDTFF